MLLDFLRPHMDVSDNEAFSVYPGKTNNPGDIIKGCSFRRLNVTRKIIIKDVPDLLRSALNMQTFALGHQCLQQSRGSPMGSPLSPAFCLMVVSISKQIWSINFKQIISNHNLFIRHIRYVDNRLMFGDSRLRGLPPYEVLLDEGFYGKPIILETEPLQEFLGFTLETQPLELIYQGPTNISQVLSPFSASPPKVLLSGFRSRCHIVVKGAFPDFRVRQGLDQIIHLYTLAGFPNGELHTISSQILIQHQNLQTHEQKSLVVSSFVVSSPLCCFCCALFSPLRVVLAWLKPAFLFFVTACSTWPWIMPKAGNFIITWVGPSCLELPGGASSLFRTINRMGWPTQRRLSSFWAFKSSHTKSSYIHLFLFLALPQHRQWHLMGLFPPTWYWTQNRTFGHSPLPAVHAMMRATLPLGLPHDIRLQQPVLHQSLFQGYQHLTSLVQQPEQQRLSLFDQNKDQIRPKIHNQRRNSVRSSRRISRLYALPYSSTNHWRSSSWRLQFRGLRRRSGLQGPLSPYHVSNWRWPCHHFADWQPNHLQELQLQQILHRTPPFASSNRQNPTGAIVLRLSALGQTLKTKNWSISRMTVNHALHGNRLAPDYDLILRRAKFVGTFWSKCPINMARRRLDTNQKQKQNDSVWKRRSFSSLILEYSWFLFLLSLFVSPIWFLTSFRLNQFQLFDFT